MSNYSQPGFFFGILQRGANPIGIADRGRRMPSRQGALQQPAMLDNGTSPAGIDNPVESPSTPNFNKTTQHQSQTHAIANPQIRQSQTLSPVNAIDASPEESPEEFNATATRSRTFPQADSKQAEPSSAQVKPSTTTTFSEVTSTVELTGTTHADPQTKPVVQPHLSHSQPQTTTHAPASREKPNATATRTNNSVCPGSAVDSFSQPAKSDATQLDANLLPVTGPVQTDVKPLWPDTQSREPRLPRLTVIERGGKTVVSDNSALSMEEKGIVVSEENRDAFKSQPAGEPLTNEPLIKQHRPSSIPPLFGQDPTVRTHAQVDMPTQANRFAIARPSASDEVQFEDQPAIRVQAEPNEAIEPVRVLRPPEIQVLENSHTQRRSRISASPQQALSQGQIGSEPEDAQEISAAGFSVLPAHSERAKAGLALAQTERRVEPLRWHDSFPEKTEEQFSRRSSGWQQQRREPVPKLTINRLDVQIINQPPAPAAAQPTAPAEPSPGPKADGWEKLERYQLGHLDLIF